MPLSASNGSSYWREDMPKCPHCDHVCDINKLEWFQLYDTQEGEHEVECPMCDKSFMVRVTCNFVFGTDEQPEPDSAGDKP